MFFSWKCICRMPATSSNCCLLQQVQDRSGSVRTMETFEWTSDFCKCARSTHSHWAKNSAHCYRCCRPQGIISHCHWGLDFNLWQVATHKSILHTTQVRPASLPRGFNESWTNINISTSKSSERSAVSDPWNLAWLLYSWIRSLFHC